MKQHEVDVIAWMATEDAVRLLLPVLGRDALAVCSAWLRPGCGGPWEGMATALEARRTLLRIDVDGRLAAVVGCDPSDIPGTPPVAVPDYPPD